MDGAASAKLANAQTVTFADANFAKNYSMRHSALPPVSGRMKCGFLAETVRSAGGLDIVMKANAFMTISKTLRLIGHHLPVISGYTLPIWVVTIKKKDFYGFGVEQILRQIFQPDEYQNMIHGQER
jgi:hypothetical protein